MVLPPVLASLLANPHRTLLGLGAIVGAFAPVLVDAPPGVTRWAHVAASVCTVLAAMVESAEAGGKAGE